MDANTTTRADQRFQFMWIFKLMFTNRPVSANYHNVENISNN
jgi:hypothetical protein